MLALKVPRLRKPLGPEQTGNFGQQLEPYFSLGRDHGIVAKESQPAGVRESEGEEWRGRGSSLAGGEGQSEALVAKGGPSLGPPDLSKAQG